MASEAVDAQGKLNSSTSLLEQAPTGSSVWNLCSIPGDSQAVDLRDITPSISPVFTEDQVRELSGQTGDLDVLGDNFLPHETFKRIAEVLSPEQTNLLINTCTSLCSESGVTSSLYSDPLMGCYSSQHGLNPPPGSFPAMDPSAANTNQREIPDQTKHFSKPSGLSISTEDNCTTDQDAGDVKTQSDNKAKEESIKQSDVELNKDSELQNAKDSKTKSENVTSSYSLRSSPRKPTKEGDIKSSTQAPAQTTKDKKEPIPDTQRRRSPRGQKHPDTEGHSQSKRGQRKHDAKTANEEDSKQEGKSLRRSSRSSRIQKGETSPAVQSHRKGGGTKKKSASEEKNDAVETEDHPETTSEKDQQTTDTQSNEDAITEKDDNKETTPGIKDDTNNISQNKTDACSEKQLTDNIVPDTRVEVGLTTASVAKTDLEPVSKEENFIARKDLVPTEEVLSKTNQIKAGEGSVGTNYMSTGEGSGNRGLHILPSQERIVHRSLLPTGEGMVESGVLGTDIKDMLTAEKDIMEIIEKEINEPHASFHITKESVEVEKKEDIPKVKEPFRLEEGKPVTTKRKGGNKKDLQPSRRSNRISESIQKREIEVAVKKAQEEMFREREEQERLEREEQEKLERKEQERLEKEEQERKKKEEEKKIGELKRKEEEENEMELEKEPDEKELKEKEIAKTNVTKKKERNEQKSKEEPKKTKTGSGKKESKSEIKVKESHNKTADKADTPSPDKTRKISTDKSEEKSRKISTDKNEEKSKLDSDGSTLFAVGGDHEVYSTVKYKRQSSESDKSKDKNKEKHAESSSSDEDKESDEEPVDDDDSDYDPEYDPERLWCICRKPHGNRFMICCDSCEEWLHGDCVSITKQIGKEMEKNGIEYICPRCVIAKRRLKEEQGIDPNKDKEADESSPVKRKRRHRRLKFPGEKYRRHSSDSKKRKHKEEKQERKHKNESQRDNSDSKSKNIDPGTFYKIPKKVRTTPTPASFASRTHRKCINSDCQNHAETGSVYCSDACISKHAKESLSLLQDERKKRIGNTPKPTTSPSPVNVPMPWEAPHSTVPTSPHMKERVAVIERSTGHVIAGVAAPAEQDLAQWLHRHPTFEVIKPTVSKEVKKPDKREEEKSVRENVKRSLKEILSSRINEVPELKLSFEDITKFAINIEEDLYKLFGDAGPRYKSKYRSLAFNLKDIRNKVLFHHVLCGEVPTDRLVSMTAEQLASQELARWRERETKHTIDMIKENQLDINASKGHIKKTHKGEIELDEDADLSNLEVHTKSEVAEPDSNTSPGPLLIDTTDQHRIHLFDLNCRICTGKMQPPGEPPRQEDTLMLVSTSTPIQALAESSVPSPPPIGVDIPSVSSTESLDIASLSPAAPIKPVKRDKPVWKGYVMMQSVSKFSTSAYMVSGPCDDLLQLLPDTLHLQGRIGFGQVWDYVHQLRHSTTRDVSIVRYEVSSDDEKTSYVSLYSYFYSRKRCGVVSNCYTGVKDMYLMPLASHSPVPSELLPFTGPGLEEPRPHMLLGIIVRTKANFKRPRPVHQRTLSPTPKRRHGSSKSSEGSQAKDSPPSEIEDIVFQYNKRISLETKPNLSPSSGSSDHSSTLSSPSVGVSSVATDNPADTKVNTPKTQQEELQDLADRAKQHIASALQSKKKADQTVAETTDGKKSSDSDKPYDPEEEFDLDLELEKPIDEKKSVSHSSAKAPMKSSDVSSSEVVLPSTGDIEESKSTTSNALPVVSLPTTGSSVPSASIPLLDTVSSSTPTTSTLPAVPASIFMPITTSTVTTTSLSTQVASLSIPSTQLAGIVKLLKQVNSAGQSAIQGQPMTDTHKASSTSSVSTTTPTATRQDSHTEPDSYHPPRSSTTAKQSCKSVSEGSRRHGDHTSETERQRIDRERLEWRERRASREGPRDHGDNAPNEDRWGDQRDSHAPPMRRASDDRYHGESYGPHRGSHGDRGRYQPYHRDEHRGDRRADRRDDPRWKERWRR